MTLAAVLPVDARIAAIARIILFVVLLVPTISNPRRYWRVVAVCGLVIGSAILSLTDELAAQAAVGFVASAFIASLIFDYIDADPRAIRVLLATKEAEWSRQRHELVNHSVICEGIAHVLRDRLEKNEIDVGDIPIPPKLELDL